MAKPVLYYDGPCRLCQRSVQWVHHHVPGVVCKPLQSDEAKEVLPKALTTPPLKGVVLMDPEGRVQVGHKALHAMAPFAKGPWRWLLRLVPSWGYALVARTRWILGRVDTCSMPR